MKLSTRFALASAAWTITSAAFGATVSFAYTGGSQTWTVPPGVTQVTLELRGAQGGGSYACSGVRQEDGGLGGLTQGTLAVTPGQVLNLFVGGQAADVGNITPAPGGFNGGGDGGTYGAGGGGATDVRVGGTALLAGSRWPAAAAAVAIPAAPTTGRVAAAVESVATPA